MPTRTIASLLITCLLLLFPIPLFAGGWAVVTIDELPQHLRAGETTMLGFTVRQHGQHPVNLENVILRATDPTSGETLTFIAHQTGDIGHYEVEVMLPNPGLWAWEIQPDWFPVMTMAPMTVLAAGSVGNATPVYVNGFASLWPWLLTGVGALLLSSAALSPRFANRRFRMLIGGVGILMLVSGFGWAVLSTRAPQAVAAQPAAATAYGRALFMAKGCNSCHLHAQASNVWSTEMGPNLTDYQNSAAYLHRWLKDPQSIKPNTEMPNLALKADEIDALAAFLAPAKP